MPFVTRKSLLTLGALAIAGVLIAGGFVWSGVYNIGADDTHTRPVHALLETVRDRSIEQRARSIQLPDLSDAALIHQGAGNYDAMCTGCHLAPGMRETELSKGLYPAPPLFAKASAGNPKHHFWVIKHGIKATGMPAWGKSMEDEYIWGMVAFIQQLPDMDEAAYKAMVASSGGHSHGGGETADHHDEGTQSGHPHDETMEAGHDMAGMAASKPETAEVTSTDEGEVHTHADGAQHVHEKKSAATTAKPADSAAADESSKTVTPEPAADEHAEHEHQH